MLSLSLTHSHAYRKSSQVSFSPSDHFRPSRELPGDGHRVAVVARDLDAAVVARRDRRREVGRVLVVLVRITRVGPRGRGDVRLGDLGQVERVELRRLLPVADDGGAAVGAAGRGMPRVEQVDGVSATGRAGRLGRAARQAPGSRGGGRAGRGRRGGGRAARGDRATRPRRARAAGWLPGFASSLLQVIAAGRRAPARASRGGPVTVGGRMPDLKARRVGRRVEAFPSGGTLDGNARPRAVRGCGPTSNPGVARRV